MSHQAVLIPDPAHVSHGESRRSTLQWSVEELNRGERIARSELELAARVHESLLPQPVRHPRIDVETRYVPVHGVGGDYCQVLFPDEASCWITICDVTGHGIGPALLATRVSSEVLRLTSNGLRPSDVVAELNAFLLRHFADTELQVSFFGARLDLEQRQITYSGAGHPEPLLIRGASSDIELLRSQNMLLGVSGHCLSETPEHRVPLAAGDRLLLFTDGLTETRTHGGRLLGEGGLIELARDLCPGTVSQVVDCILERVGQRRVGPAHDDMTLIAAEMK